MDILSKNHYYCNGQSIQVPRLHQRGVNENYQNIGCCFLRVYTFLDLNDLLWRYGKILIAASTANLFMGVFLPQYKLYLIRLPYILDKSQNIIFLVCKSKNEQLASGFGEIIVKLNTDGELAYSSAEMGNYFRSPDCTRSR